MLEDTLLKVFGFSKFRGMQKEVVKNILNGKHTLVIMATGSGKSLCYQLPATLQEGMVIVISPLIALMKSQVDFLHEKKIKAACMNSSIPKKTLHTIKEEVSAGKIKLLYIAPETLNKEETIELLQQTKVSFIAVDEAHCISDWGHDFRPDYRKTRQAIKELGNPPVIALTATATPKVEADIIKNLDMEGCRVFKSSFHRSNLYYEVRPKQQTEKQIIEFIKGKEGQAGIIYCHSRKKAEQLASFLTLNGINAAPYHAGLDRHTREKHQDLFLHNKIDVMVATIAFGMGIDKPNVRFVIHYDAPKSLEGYYQETGRAGRDGNDSTCILFYEPDDILKLQKLNRKKTTFERENNNRLLQEVSAYAHSALCRTQQLLYYFGEKYHAPCQHCDNCTHDRPSYEAQKLVTTLLQAIQLTKEKYQSKDIIHILLGITEEHIVLDAANKLPIFGVGEALANSEWQSIIKQLLLQEYLHVDDPDVDILALTPKANAFLKKPHSLHLLKDLSYATPQGAETQTASKEVHDQALLDKLFKERTHVALQEDLKPYLIFQEKSLKAMATYYPTSLEQLGQLTNIGISKAHKFGKPFIKIVQAHINENNIQPPQHIIIKSASAKSSKRIHIIQQIDRKTNLKVVAKQNGLAYDELITELEDICYSGIKLSLDYYIDQLIDEEAQDDLYDYFYDVDEDNIEQAIEDLQDEFTTEEIRLVHIKFLSEVAY